jgi:hypothetical protein
MGLNDIKLSPTLTVALYGNLLVEGTAGKLSAGKEIFTEEYILMEEAEAPEPPPPPGKKKIGNQKNILIVVKNDTVVHLPDEELEFLTNILKACQLSLDAVAIVNTNNAPDEGYKEYAKKFSSKIVLLFGIEPVSFDLPVNFPEFQVQSLNNTTFLYSPSLLECRTDKLLKSKLWVCLQRIFGL